MKALILVGAVCFVAGFIIGVALTLYATGGSAADGFDPSAGE